MATKKETNEKVETKPKKTKTTTSKVKNDTNKKETTKTNAVKTTKTQKKTTVSKKKEVKEKKAEEKQLIDNISNSNEEFFDIIDDKKKLKKAKKEAINKSEYYDILENDKSRFWPKLLIFLIVIGSLSFIVYRFVIKDSKTIFNSGITKLYELGANNLFKLSKSPLINDKFRLTGVLKYNTDNKEYLDLTYNLYDINIDYNKNNHNFKGNLSVKNNNKELVNTTYYHYNDKFYIDLGNEYNKIIELKQDIFDINSNIINFNNININKLNDSAKLLKNIINNNIKREQLTKEEKEIDNEKYEIVELKLNNNEYTTLLSKIIDDIKNNDNLMNNLTSTFNVDNNTIREYLDNILKNNLVNTFENISFKFYANGFLSTVKGFEIIVDNNIMFYYLNDNIIINYDKYYINIYKEDNKYKANIKKEDKDYLSLVFNELNDNVIDVDYKYLDTNNYGVIHLTRFDKDSDKSGNLTFSIVTKNDKTSYVFDYRFENYNDIKVENSIKSEDIEDDDILLIDKNVNNNILNKNIKKEYINRLNKIFNY